MISIVAAALFTLATKQEMVVSSEWLNAHLNDPLVVVVEVGDRADYDAGHIPGARFVAREEIVADCDGLANELPPDDALIATFTSSGVGDWKRIVIYSRDPLLAARAWFSLDYLGHGYRASVLDGGFDKWNADRRQVSTAKMSVLPAPFTVATRPFSVVKFDTMRTLVRNRSHSNIVMIDARSSLNFSGEIAGSGVKRRGHIPGAVNVPWTANLTSDAPHLLRDPESLRQMYDSVGVTQETAVVTYCRTGMEATMTYFVLRYLGYDVALYDGSFVEWSASSDTMVARSDGIEAR